MPITLLLGNHRHTLKAARNRIGRANQCELSIPGGDDSVVSWEHACLEYHTHGLTLTDLGSTNGTFLNGVKLARMAPASVRPGDRIRFGMKGPELLIEAITPLAPEPVAELIPPEPPRPKPVVQLPSDIPTVLPPRPIPAPYVPPSPAFDEPPILPPSAPPAVYPQRSAPVTGKHATTTQLHRAVMQLRGEKRTATILALVGVVVAVVGIGLIIGLTIVQSRKKPVPTTESTEPAPPPPLTPAELQSKLSAQLANSVVWIYCDTGSGSGCLVEGPERYILTAEHVVRGAKTIQIAFPHKRADGSLETDRVKYIEKKWMHEAKLERFESKADLAILSFKGKPDDNIVPLKLAPAEPDKGHTCHTLANQGNSGLWVYAPGSINQIEFRKVKIQGQGTVYDIQTWMLQSTVPLNPGDSGGALVNDRCELIGINSWVGVKMNAFNNHVATRTIKAFLANQPLPDDK